METPNADCYAPTHALLSTDNALAQLQQHLCRVEVESLPLMQCHGRFLAQPLHSLRDIPGFDNAAMDGYAIAVADIATEGTTNLRIQSESRAGHPSQEKLNTGCAMRILTGAQLPSGADTIIPQEEVTVVSGHIVFSIQPRMGQHVRKIGEDVAKNELLLNKGSRLRPQDVAIAAATGFTALNVYKPLRVALFSTGDEIIEPGSPLSSDGVYDANRYLLNACLAKFNCIITDYGIMKDNPQELASAFREAALQHDLILTSGGASTSTEDHIANLLNQFGRIYFWRLAIKPGRPLLFGQLNKALFVGFPGNPVAVMVCFVRFIAPLIAQLSGGQWKMPITYPLTAAFSYHKKNNRREWLRAQLIHNNDMMCVKPFEKKGTGIISSLTHSDGLIEIPEEITSIAPGDTVYFTPYEQFYC